MTTITTDTATVEYTGFANTADKSLNGFFPVASRPDE